MNKGNRIVILNIPNGESDYLYTVNANNKLTLVIVAKNYTDASVSVRVALAGRGASATIVGLIQGSGTSKISLHTLQQHKAPDTTSDLLVKTILRDWAKCQYDGGIRVEKKAQKTDAYQRNENLLLSGHSYAESKPSLEILANDVRCTHGATAGPINDEQLWYLASRGIKKSDAEILIAEGFLQSAVDRIDDETVKEHVWQLL